MLCACPSICRHRHYTIIIKCRRVSVRPRRAAIHPTNDSTHAQQAPSNSQTNGQRRNPETVEHALSKGTAANAVHNHRLHPFEQSADFQPNSDTMSSELCKNIRDRLGLWGTISESEVAGNVSGLERLRSARYNKVCIFSVFHLS